MKHAQVINIPNNPREIFDEALSKSYDFHIDEKGTKQNPSIWKRETSTLSYEEAFEIIKESEPHWVICFRNESYFSDKLTDYWEFGGCNIGSNEYGEVFIFILVKPEIAEEIFKKFNLTIEEY